MIPRLSLQLFRSSQMKRSQDSYSWIFLFETLLLNSTKNLKIVATARQQKVVAAKARHSMPDSRGAAFCAIRQPADFRLPATVGSKADDLIDHLDIFGPTRNASNLDRCPDPPANYELRICCRSEVIS
jgi:hypothetical protein